MKATVYKARIGCDGNSNGKAVMRHRFTIPQIDASSEEDRRIVIAKDPKTYLGQPDTVLLGDNETIILVYPLGHGGPGCVIRRSLDKGLTWPELIAEPEGFANAGTAPTICRIMLPAGRERLLIFTAQWPMQMSISDDRGLSWTPLRKIIGNAGGYAPPKTAMRIDGTNLLAVYQDRYIDGCPAKYPANVLKKRGISGAWRLTKIVSKDDGISWSQPQPFSDVDAVPGALPCEPALIRSPDGRQILCMARDNSRKYNSLYCLSLDEGETWTSLKELPGALTGDRHVARYAPDGRMVVTFRDMAKFSKTKGDFVAWIGTFEDIVQGREGEYRVRLLDNFTKPRHNVDKTKPWSERIQGYGDTGYAGLEVLRDGTFVSTTYCRFREDQQPVIVGIRFHLSEFDRLKQ